MRTDGRSVVGGRDPAVGLYVGPEVAVEEVFGSEAGQRRGEFERDVFPFGTALWAPEFERIDSDVFRRSLPAEVGDRGIDGVEYRSQAGNDLRTHRNAYVGIGHEADEDVLRRVVAHSEIDGQSVFSLPEVENEPLVGRVRSVVAPARRTAQFDRQPGRLVRLHGETDGRNRAADGISSAAEQSSRKRVPSGCSRSSANSLDALIRAFGGSMPRPNRSPGRKCPVRSSADCSWPIRSRPIRSAGLRWSRQGDCGRRADRLPAVCGGAHDARGAVGHMADADDTASDEEVVRIGRHQTAVGNLVDALAVPLGCRRALRRKRRRRGAGSIDQPPNETAS